MVKLPSVRLRLKASKSESVLKSRDRVSSHKVSLDTLGVGSSESTLDHVGQGFYTVIYV